MNGLIPHFYEGDLWGEVSVGGIDPSVEPITETAARVGSVFQNPRSQFFNVDTTSELAFACENMGWDVSRIDALSRMRWSGSDSDPCWIAAFSDCPAARNRRSRARAPRRTVPA